MPNSRRPIVVTAVILVLFLCAFTAAGLLLRNFVAASFRTAEEIRVARSYAADVLEHQLDEETGVRGYAATGASVFLEPYFLGRAHIGLSLTRLIRALDSLGLAAHAETVRDAMAANTEWVHTVAAPLLVPHPANALAIEQRGKRIVDRFRADIATVDGALADLELTVDSRAQRSIELVGAFVFVTMLVLSVLAIGYTAQQARLATRAAEEQARVEGERRKTAEFRAAYEAEKRIGDTLQGAFSQRPLPEVASLRFSATYVPATEETKIGGDWYDAFDLGGGRVMFVIGDVAGHGIEAAVTMNRARQALVSCALLDADPASVLMRTSAELARERAPMVTALAGFADARTYEFAYATAGHPPPVLIEPGRPPRLLECGSLPLAVVPNPSYRTHRIQSVPGAMLVLYTDGAVEHSRDVLAGEALLLAATARAAADIDGDAATTIHDTIFQDHAVGDDVAILTISFSRDPATELTLSADSMQSSFLGRLSRRLIAPKGIRSDALHRHSAAAPGWAS